MGVVGNSINWILVIIGVVCVIAELALGAITGFDLALIGGSLAVGGAIGLGAHSGEIGLFAAGILAFVYLAIFRRWLRSKLTGKEQPTNVDAIVGKTGVVTQRITMHEAGMIRVAGEIWRAALAGTEEITREPGATVTVESVDGVTLKVR